MTAPDVPGRVATSAVDDPRTATALTTGDSRLRRAVFEVAQAGLVAADPGAATRRVVGYDPRDDVVTVEGRSYPLGGRGRVLVIGAGKATHPIAAALVEILGSRIGGGVVAARDPAARDLEPLRVLTSDHPLPTARSARAAEAILDCARSAGPDDLVLACFTGGSSALASLPPEGVPLADKRVLHELLLASGLAITDINAVRKQVSLLKGGRVALAALPARLVNLTVSDVAGSPLDAVTDPTVADRSSARQAREVLGAAGLWDAVPEAVRRHLLQDLPTPAIDTPHTVVLADGASTVRAMAAAVESAGYRPMVVAEEVEGDARSVAERLCGQALAAAAADPRPLMLVGCGGESVVSLGGAGGFGDGGPNQECALVAAAQLAGHRAAAIFLDTDGSDGGTVYAGAVADGTTAARASVLGIDLQTAVSHHRSTAACEKLGSAIWLGHTGTNVNDLFVIAVAKEDPR